MLKIAGAVEMTITDPTDVVLSQVVEIFHTFAIPDRAVAIIASLT